MKKTPPPLPYLWDTEDPFLRNLTLEQDGSYRRLLDSCWRDKGLPKEIMELAFIAGYLPAARFEDAVWIKIEGQFYPKAGKLQSAYLDAERDRLSVISENQSRRAKNPRKKPPANGRLSPGKPQVPIIKVIVKQEQPPVIPRETGGKPAASPRVESESFTEASEAPGEPAVSPRLIEGPEEKFQITTAEEIRKISDDLHDEVKNLDSPLKKMLSQENGQNVPEVNFDREAAWKRVLFSYPGEVASHGREAFDREIVSRQLWDRLWRALVNYRQSGKKDHFYDWFPKWTAWEDPEPVKK